MLLTQVLATAFAIIGCCITIYVCIYNCYCIAKGVEVNEYHLMVVVVTGVSTMCIIFVLTLLSSILEHTLHLIS